MHQLTAQTKGTAFGLIWLILLPLLMIIVYNFAFSIVMKASYGAGIKREYFILVLYSNLILFGLFGGVLQAAVNLLKDNEAIVKQLSLPLEILPIALILSHIWQYLLSLSVFAVFYFFKMGSIDLSLIYLLCLIIPYIIFINGLCFFLSALGAFICDLGQIIGVLVTALLFLSPVFYPLDRIPPKFQAIFSWSPIAIVLDWQKAILFFGSFPPLLHWFIFLFTAIIFSVLAILFYGHVKKGFADVI